MNFHMYISGSLELVLPDTASASFGRYAIGMPRGSVVETLFNTDLADISIHTGTLWQRTTTFQLDYSTARSLQRSLGRATL